MWSVKYLCDRQIIRELFKLWAEFCSYNHLTSTNLTNLETPKDLSLYWPHIFISREINERSNLSLVLNFISMFQLFFFDLIQSQRRVWKSGGEGQLVICLPQSPDCNRVNWSTKIWLDRRANPPPLVPRFRRPWIENVDEFPTQNAKTGFRERIICVTKCFYEYQSKADEIVDFSLSFSK